MGDGNWSEAIGPNTLFGSSLAGVVGRRQGRPIGECHLFSGDFSTGAESNLAELRVNATRVELA